MHIVNTEGNALFDVDDDFNAGDRIGFGLENTPGHCAVFTVLEVRGDTGIVGLPQLVILPPARPESAQSSLGLTRPLRPLIMDEVVLLSDLEES